MIINELQTGRRVWTFSGFHEQGHDKVSVPPQTGGVIVSSFNKYMTINDPLYVVQWDTGQKSTYYGNQLVCIGQYRTYSVFEQAIAKDAERAKKTVGPMGGIRRFTLHLRNGDTVEGCANVEPLLQQAQIPIETEIIPRKPSRGRS